MKVRGNFNESKFSKILSECDLVTDFSDYTYVTHGWNSSEIMKTSNIDIFVVINRSGKLQALVRIEAYSTDRKSIVKRYFSTKDYSVGNLNRFLVEFKNLFFEVSKIDLGFKRGSNYHEKFMIPEYSVFRIFSKDYRKLTDEFIDKYSSKELLIERIHKIKDYKRTRLGALKIA